MKFVELLRLSVLEYRDGGLIHLIRGALEKVILEILGRIDRGISTKFRWKYFQWRCSDDINEYKYPPDPFKIIQVDPNNINKVTKRRKPHLNRRIHFGKVKDGDWDINNLSFEKQPIYRAGIKRFKKNIPWREITEVQEQIEQVQNTQLGTKSHRDKNQVLISYKKFENLFEIIKQEGYQSQANLLDEIQRTDNLYPTELDEVAVDIGRNGELLYADGKHRLTIAKLLDISTIPVVVHVRHSDWMVYREKVAGGYKNDKHPDLKDI